MMGCKGGSRGQRAGIELGDEREGEGAYIRRGAGTGAVCVALGAYHESIASVERAGAWGVLRHCEYSRASRSFWDARFDIRKRKRVRRVGA